MEGNRKYNLDVVVVPFEGANYEAHGIKYKVVPFLSSEASKHTLRKSQH